MTTAPSLIGDLADRLRPHLPDIALNLLGEPSSRTRTEWRWGSKGGLVANVGGPRVGVWHDFSSGGHGDALDLLTRELGDRDQALDFARRWLGDDGQPRPRPRPAAKPVAAVAARETLDPRWLRYWRSCRIINDDSVAARYLRARGCATPQPDGDLRWHPECRHPSGYSGAALVALITDVHDPARQLTLLRTWIMADGRKAEVNPPRMLLKSHSKKGGVVRLRPDDAVGPGLGIAEGVETALTLARVGLPVWSCVDASNLAVFPVLAGIRCLSIAVDDDQAGRAAADACAARWREAGCEVILA